MSTLAEQFSQYCNLAYSLTVDENFLYLYFLENNSSKLFIDWITQLSELKESFISNPISLKSSFPYKYVSISHEQFNLLMGNNAFSKLLPEEEIKKAQNVLVKDFNNIETWEKILNSTHFADEFNQRRLLSAHNYLSIYYTGSYTNIIYTLVRHKNEAFIEKAISLINSKVLSSCTGILLAELLKRSDSIAKKLIQRMPSVTIPLNHHYYENEYTILHIAALYQKDDTCKKLFNKFSSTALSESIKIADLTEFTAFDYLLTKRKYDAVITILQSVDVETLEFLVDAERLEFISEECKQPVFENLIEKIIAETEDKNLLKKILELYPNDLLDQVIENWINGIDTSPNLAEIIREHLSSPYVALNEKRLAYHHFLDNYQTNSALSIKTSHSEIISLDDAHKDKEIDKIFQQGLASWLDYYILTKYLRQSLHRPKQESDNDILFLNFILDNLREENAVCTGMQFPYESFLNFPGVLEKYNSYLEIYNCIRHENGLIKIIKPEHFNDFVEQLKNYNYRPKLRYVIDKTDHLHTHKFVHLEQKIVPYESRKRNKKQKNYQSLKKQSFTLLSYKLNTHLYGEHHPDNLMVGMLFDQDFCLPAKAFFKYDRGTHPREWVGSEEEVKKYQKEIQSILLKDIAQMRKFARENPDMTEVLARVTREACVGICIARDTPTARKEAKSRQQLLQQIGIQVPIFLYDNKSQKITLYDEKPLLKYAKAKYFLVTSLENLTNTKNKKLPDNLVKQISDLVEQAKKQETTNPEMWFHHNKLAKEILKNFSPSIIPSDSPQQNEQEDNMKKLLQKNESFEKDSIAFKEEVEASKLSKEAKHCCSKVMDCLLYINDNLTLFKHQVDNQDDPNMYERGVDKHGHHYDNYETKTMRDKRKTGYHVNYPDSKKALLEMHGMFEQIQGTLKKLSHAKRLEFATKFIYDPKVGCVDARMSTALIWASSLNWPLHDIMELSNKHHENAGLSTAEYAWKFCTINKITLCDHEGQSSLPVTYLLLKNYARDILLEEDTLASQFLSFCKLTSKQEVTKDFIYLYFSEKSHSGRFIDWLKRLRELTFIPPAIKLNYSYFQRQYYLSFTPEQFDFFMGTNAFSKLLPGTEISKPALQKFFQQEEKGIPDQPPEPESFERKIR